MPQKKNPHLGLNFDAFLEEQGLLDEVNASATKRVLEILLAQGDALEQVRDIHYFAYFPAPEARANFIEKALSAGFKLGGTSEPCKPGADFGAILTSADIPDEQTLEKIAELLTRLAENEGGNFDGWETQIVS